MSQYTLVRQLDQFSDSPLEKIVAQNRIRRDISIPSDPSIDLDFQSRLVIFEKQSKELVGNSRISILG